MNSPKIHIAILGAGNMGSLYGANLARIGQRVTFIDPWVEHVEAIRSRGLRMDGLHGEFVVSADAAIDASDVTSVDVAIVLVNAYATLEAAKTAKAILKADGFALTLQNGLGNIEALTSVLGKDRVVAGLSFHSADLKGPGEVTHSNHGPTYLGEIDRAKSSRLEMLRGLMDEAEMNPVVEDDIVATTWGKFVLNCGLNAICAITDLRPGHIREVPDLDDFQTRIIEEAVALVRAKGIEIPEEDPLSVIKTYGAKKFHRVSMLQHLARGRRTEIDALNGYVAKESEKLGLSAPCNDALTRLMKGRHYVPKGEWGDDSPVDTAGYKEKMDDAR